MYYLESLFIWFAFTLDLAHEVAPVIEKELPEASSIKVVLVYLLAARVAFGSKLASFFGHKVCCGVEEVVAGLGTQTDTGEQGDGASIGHTTGMKEPVAGPSSTSTGTEGRDEGTSSTSTRIEGRDESTSSTSWQFKRFELS